MAYHKNFSPTLLDLPGQRNGDHVSFENIPSSQIRNNSYKMVPQMYLSAHYESFLYVWL